MILMTGLFLESVIAFRSIICDAYVWLSSNSQCFASKDNIYIIVCSYGAINMMVYQFEHGTLSNNCSVLTSRDNLIFIA